MMNVIEVFNRLAFLCWKLVLNNCMFVCLSGSDCSVAKVEGCESERTLAPRTRGKSSLIIHAL